MGKNKSHRASLKMAAVIRKKAKAKRQKERKEAKTKQYPKRSKKVLPAPQRLPDREFLEAQVRESSAFLNDVIRPIEGTRQSDKGKKYDAQLEQFRDEIMVKYRENVMAAQGSYEELLNTLEEAELIIEVLDARDPNACRLLEAEGMYIGKKPWIMILTKIDLVPQESVIRWMGTLRQVAPTVAISAYNEASPAVIQEVVTGVAPAATKCAVIGPRGVGKSMICSINPGLFHEVSSYRFLAQTGEMGLLKGVDFLDPEYDLALDVISRSQNGNVFEVCQIPAQEDPEAVLNALGKKWMEKPRKAAKTFMEKIWCGDYKFYAVPEDTVAEGLTQVQMAALQASIPLEMSGLVYIEIASGEALTIDEQILAVTEADLAGEAGSDGEEEEDDDE